MNIDNPAALHFIMQDDLFFLDEDRKAYADTEIAVTEPVKEVVPTEPVLGKVEPVLEAKVVEFTFMGKKGGMLILVHYPATEFIHDAHLTALENILKRKDVAIGDVAILNMAKRSDTGFESLINYFGSKKILVLGKQALPAGIATLGLNAPKQLADSMALYSFSFDEMMDSPENKKAFWEQMKNF